MTISRSLAVLLPVAMLAGCTGLSRETRVERKLEQAGVKPKLARCLAPRLARDLSDDQLRALAAAAKAPEDGGHKSGAHALSKRLAAIDDPKLADIVSRAALACTILG